MMRPSTKVGTLYAVTHDMQLTVGAIYNDEVIHAADRDTGPHQRSSINFSLCIRTRTQTEVYATAGRHFTDYLAPLLTFSFTFDNMHHAVRRQRRHLSRIISSEIPYRYRCDHERHRMLLNSCSWNFGPLFRLMLERAFGSFEDEEPWVRRRPACAPSVGDPDHDVG